ncbi:MAG: transposase [Halioglobus sp.]|jgi:transposase
MATFQLSDNDLEQVSRERYEHPSPMVQKRMTVLYLKHIGMKHKDVAKGAQCSMTSVATWLSQYRAKGLNNLRGISGRIPYSKLAAHKETLEEYFQNNPVATVREAQDKIAALTGIFRSKKVVRNFLRSIGLSYRKAGSMPGKADPERQETFKKNPRALLRRS